MSVKRFLSDSIVNLRGWRTDRRIVVIESDDWGSERTPSKEVLKALKDDGFNVEACHYMMNDSLASERDLENLFELLMKYKDSGGIHPLITANCIMVNPDFARIKADGFRNYYFEHFRETLKRYPEHQNSFSLWKAGMDDGVFHPELHGREHLNVSLWMRDLRNGLGETARAFDLGVFAVSRHIVREKRGSYLAAFDRTDGGPLHEKGIIVEEAVKLFQDTFGYASESFVAPNYVWDDPVESVLHQSGVRYIQGIRNQYLSEAYERPKNTRPHYQGQKNHLGQRYLVRNVIFEPASSPNIDWVDRCMAQISTAFRYGKPAVISSHRVNYVGFINAANRDRNLRLLNLLLQSLLRRWPDVRFLSSGALGRLIDEG